MAAFPNPQQTSNNENTCDRVKRLLSGPTLPIHCCHAVDAVMTAKGEKPNGHWLNK